ncbi:MAG: DUF3426 domain-containing protein [Deltaproteobacteria bacterium]|nr:DUF3426 domain-containing protein [Deltaproteobacteria bacterium]
MTSEDVPEDGFLLNAPAAPKAPRPKPRKRPPAPEQTALRFDAAAEEGEDDEEPEEDDDALADDDQADDADADDPAVPARAAVEADAPLLITDDEPAPRSVSRKKPPLAARAAPPRMRGGGGGIGVRSVFVFLAVVVGAYGALTWSLLDDPDWARRLTLSLPVIGSTLRERSAGDAVALIDVEGHYERTKDGKAVFVITGKAVNRSPESLRKLEILAVLYDANQQRIEQQVTACGNPLEAKIRELSVPQVSILRSIKPPPDFGVQPGAQCPFASIFVDVPERAATYTTEVSRAQRTT